MIYRSLVVAHMVREQLHCERYQDAVQLYPKQEKIYDR
jgi:hypothetical protein